MKKHNFNAGPAILPAPVLEKAAESALNYEGIGLSVLEISHRSAEFKSILAQAEELARELLEIGDEYAVLFLTGGASSQFFMSAMNLLNEGDLATYVDTGSWSAKAIKEAKVFGEVEVIASSKDKGYTYIPKGYAIPENSKYLHLTSNNTIFGTQFQEWPETEVPFVCDMSSDIFSRPVDLSRFDLIYAGAQKNMGPAGTTLVIVKKDILGKVERTLPTMLNYETHIAKSSAFNTPPVYAIYVSMLTMKWVKETGGLTAMAHRNEAKAKLLYDAIDASTCFVGVAATEDRSLMNATFILTEEKKGLADQFLADCAAAQCVGVKGHRSVGGFRASIYNAMPIESVAALVEVIKVFDGKHG